MRPGAREFRDASLTVSIPTTLPAHMHESMREITHLTTTPGFRRKKFATVLMNFVCQEADANAITLVLTARAYADDEDEPLANGPAETIAARMSTEQLIAWYQRFGFVIVAETPAGTFMARQVREKPRVKPVTLAVARALDERLH